MGSGTTASAILSGSRPSSQSLPMHHGQIPYESVLKTHPEFSRRVSPDAAQLRRTKPGVSHDVVIRVYEEAGNVIETRKNKSDFKEPLARQNLWSRRDSEGRNPIREARSCESCTLYGARRFVIECPAPSTTIFPAMKNSIIFISAFSLLAMMLASCNSLPSAFAPDETATTHVTSQTDETAHERSAEESVNSLSGGHY
jgi:hypothetical protein